MYCPKNKSNTLAYTAGIVDGEGCITIANSGKITGRKHRPQIMMVSVANTNEWLVQWLKMEYGGNISFANRKNRRLGCKLCYRWGISAHAALGFLELVSPYLQLKRPQAELAMKFQREKECRQKVGRRGYSDEEVAVEQAQRILIQSYNKKGDKTGALPKEVS